MPRDLFGDVTDPSVRVGSRSRYTVPLSLAAHAAAMAAVALVPLMAAAVLPAPPSTTVFVAAPPPPPPPPPPPTAAPPPPAPVAATAAPVAVPDAIVPETGLEAGFERSASITGVPDGVVLGGYAAELPSPPPPPAPAPQQPLIVGGQIAPPAKVRDVAPVYPAIAQAARVAGVVILRATIGADGHVVDVEVLRSIPLLDQAAVDAVRQWEYTPTRLNGVAVPVVMTVTVNFALR